MQALRSRKIDSLINTLAYPDPTEISKALTPGTWQALELTYDTPFSLAFDLLRLWYPTGPKMVMEVYPAWFDLEGVRPHVTLDPVIFSQAMDELLAINASLSFYPVFGGTNFGNSPPPLTDTRAHAQNHTPNHREKREREREREKRESMRERLFLALYRAYIIQDFSTVPSTPPTPAR